MDKNIKKAETLVYYYSESFKRRLVRDIERGKLTRGEARRRYQIGGKHTVEDWCRKYGRFAPGVLPRRTMAPAEDTSGTSAEARIRELERELADALLNVRVLNTMITIAEETYQIDIRKKLGAKQSSVSTLKQHPPA